MGSPCPDMGGVVSAGLGCAVLWAGSGRATSSVVKSMRRDCAAGGEAVELEVGGECSMPAWMMLVGMVGRVDVCVCLGEAEVDGMSTSRI